jgi:hypothetical protein
MRASFVPVLLLAACEGGILGGGDASLFGVSIENTGPATRAAVGVDGLYFGELEIVAYDWREGEALQAYPNWGAHGRDPSNPDLGDWSYLVPLQSGYDAARDNLLTASGPIDFTDWRDGGYSGELPSQEFVDGVGAFDVDFLEVNLYRTGIVQGNVYYGMNADLNGLETHPLHKYPTYATIDDYFTVPGFPGWPAEYQYEQTTNVLFARNDWFPDPILVQLAQAGGGTDPVTFSVAWTSAAGGLTADQEEALLSLATNGTGRRFYSRFVILPVDPTRLVFDPTTYVSPGDAFTEIDAATAEVVVGMDLSITLDDTSDLTIDDDGPNVMYAGDANNVPFGLTVAW